MDVAVEVFIPAYCCIVFTILIDCAHDMIYDVGWQ
jgi:hypothetical protein